MRRFAFLTLSVVGLALLGSGCQNAIRLTRLGGEVRSFFTDIDRMVFGIDYPYGAPEGKRQKYYGIPAPTGIHPCDD